MRHIQKQMSRVLRLNGFRQSGRHFNRRTEDGLVHVITFQSGTGWMEDEFTVNLGIVIPEFHDAANDWPQGLYYRDVDCIIRTRLGELDPEPEDLWWPIEARDWLVRELTRRFQDHAIAFFARFDTRALCLLEIRTGSAQWDLETRLPEHEVVRLIEASLLK